MNLFSRFAALMATLAGAAALLAACGGGTSQVESFKPDRVIAFGDEHSALTATGRKYSINALKATDSTLDCESNPLWVQSVASLYQYRFAECLGTATEAKAITRAALGATVAAVTRQVDAQATLGFTNKDLVLMMAGLHDIVQIYESRATGETEAQLIAKAAERGVAMGQLVNRVVGLGPRVIISTITDVGLTPYGRGKGTADAALLTRLTAAFNARLRVTILLDGRFVGLVLADETIQSAVEVPTGFGFSDVAQAACASTAALPNCDDAAAFLVTGANSTTWLWADALRFGPTMQRQLGLIAAARAQTNPF
jgi:hypothetical protein